MAYNIRSVVNSRKNMEEPLLVNPNIKVSWLSKDRIKLSKLKKSLIHLLEREMNEWQPFYFATDEEVPEDTCPSDRNFALQWQGVAAVHLDWSLETRFSAASIFDSVLRRVRVTQRLLLPVAAATLVIAAKINEEEECVGNASFIVKQAEMSVSPQELLRLELVLLQKLNWHPRRSLSLELLHTIYSLLVVNKPLEGDIKYKTCKMNYAVSYGLEVLTRCLWKLTTCPETTTIRPSVLVLALISFHLNLNTTWKVDGALPWLQNCIQVGDKELESARKVAFQYVGQCFQPVNCSSVTDSSKYSGKRKVLSFSVEQETFADIKKLNIAYKNVSQVLVKKDTNKSRMTQNLFTEPTKTPTESSGTNAESQNKNAATSMKQKDIRRPCKSSALSLSSSRFDGKVSQGEHFIPNKKLHQKKNYPRYLTKKRNTIKKRTSFTKNVIQSKIHSKRVGHAFEEAVEEEKENDRGREREEVSCKDTIYDDSLLELHQRATSPLLSPRSPHFPNNLNMKREKLKDFEGRMIQVGSEVRYRPLTYSQVLQLRNPANILLSV